MATLPIQDISATVEELERAVTEMGHVGATLPPNYDGRDLADPYFYPIYEKAQALGVPVSIHWGNGVAPPRRPAASASTRTSCCTPSAIRSSR